MRTTRGGRRRPHAPTIPTGPKTLTHPAPTPLFAVYDVYVPTADRPDAGGRVAVRDALTHQVIRLAPTELSTIGGAPHVRGTVIDTEGRFLLVAFPAGPACWVAAPAALVPVRLPDAGRAA